MLVHQSGTILQGDQLTIWWWVDYIEPLSLWKGNWSLLIGIDINSRYRFIFLAYRASACTVSDGLRSQWSTNKGSHITLNHIIWEGHFIIKGLWQWTYDHRTLWVCDILPFTHCHLIEWWNSLWKCSWGTSLEMIPVSIGQHSPGCSMYPKSMTSLWCFVPVGRMNVSVGWEVEVWLSLSFHFQGLTWGICVSCLHNTKLCVSRNHSSQGVHISTRGHRKNHIKL